MQQKPKRDIAHYSKSVCANPILAIFAVIIKVYSQKFQKGFKYSKVCRTRDRREGEMRRGEGRGGRGR